MAVSKTLTPNKVVVQDVGEEGGEEDVVEGEGDNLGGSTNDNLYHTHTINIRGYYPVLNYCWYSSILTLSLITFCLFL